MLSDKYFREIDFLERKIRLLSSISKLEQESFISHSNITKSLKYYHFTGDEELALITKLSPFSVMVLARKRAFEIKSEKLIEAIEISR